MSELSLAACRYGISHYGVPIIVNHIFYIICYLVLIHEAFNLQVIKIIIIYCSIDF